MATCNPETTKLVIVQFPEHVPKLVDAAETELKSHARIDRDACSGYFPAFATDEHLVDSIAFAREVPQLSVHGFALGFNFLRYSERPQPRLHGLHLDSDAATAVTGPNDHEQQQQEVWRLLLNFHRDRTRSVCVVEGVPVEAIECQYIDGYLAVTGGVSPENIRTVELPPRDGPQTHGVLFCANRVPHMGDDGKAGHFVAGYGLERTV
jgi:hypothetical protein